MITAEIKILENGLGSLITTSKRFQNYRHFFFNFD